jgi:hypothetical protein
VPGIQLLQRMVEYGCSESRAEYVEGLAMRRAAPLALAATVLALVAALGFVQAAGDCTTTPCVYVPLIQGGSGPAGAPEPTRFGPPPPPPTSTATITTTPVAGAATPTRTPTRTPTPTVTQNPANCAAEYPDFCIPPPPPDLNCPDIGQHNFTVLPPDRHHFDFDNDGVGCEA